jgi:RNA polymerase sigma-70 factor (ECF subfamily)
MGPGSSPQNLEVLLAAAAGSVAARDELLARYRPYLRLIAGRRLPQLVKRRTDASDVVQQTLLDAARGLDEFRGRSEPEFTAWITRLLERNLLQSMRNHTLEKRDVRRELNFGDGSDSAQMLWHSLTGDGSSPIHSVVRGESALLLAAALEQLPEEQRLAVELRYLHQRPLQEIASEMQRTQGSIAGLIRRGLEGLQQHLPRELRDAS